MAIFVVVLLSAGCAETEIADEHAIVGTLEETLRLGTDDGDGNEADLFGSVTELAVDRVGNVYVVDAQSREIRVFDAHGAHATSFGERGEAPGEFEAITAMMVDGNDRLVVADAVNARISIFDTDGTLIESHTSPMANPVRQISEFTDGRFLLVGLHEEHLAHVVDAGFRGIRAHLIPVSDVAHTGEEIERMWLQMAPGHAVPLSDDQVLYAPSVYGGRLYVYERFADDSWTNVRAIEVYTSDVAPLVVSEQRDGAALTVPMRTPDGGLVVRSLHLASVTSGLHAFGDGRALHVFSRESDDGVHFLAGIVSPDGSYEGNFIARQRRYENHLSLRTPAADPNGHIYHVDAEDYPLVRRMRIASQR